MATTVVLRGTVTREGKLELDDAPVLPPGHARVTIEVEEEPERSEDLMAFLHRIWARQEARGASSRTKAEIDAEIQAGRDEWEEHRLASQPPHCPN